MTNEWMEWNDPGIGRGGGPLGRFPLRGANHHHNSTTALASGPAGLMASGGSIGGVHNNNNVSFLNNNQHSFLNSYSLNKLASVGMGLKSHPLMKGLQKPRGDQESESSTENGEHFPKQCDPPKRIGADYAMAVASDAP
ncbi:hypothetical protein ZHAS_00014292 [Anopheles sinensis]|uniref:Uncharacterized protein n=1 Tax=Anopheles sinensis TaxID=74873 RepID=A0A084W7W0_ANOSI|nr:hypothetical protein ZHAS_00014292 [Anopheles sinensis]